MSIVIICASFKILHWKFQGLDINLLITAGLLGIVITYFISFLNKPIKKRLDFLKLAWVLARYTFGILIFLHIIKRDYQIITSIIIWLVILDYLIIEKKKGRLFN